LVILPFCVHGSGSWLETDHYGKSAQKAVKHILLFAINAQGDVFLIYSRIRNDIMKANSNQKIKA